jgi:hypothetical protein
MKSLSLTLVILFYVYTAEARVFRGDNLKAANQGWHKHRAGAGKRGSVAHMSSYAASFHDIRKKTSESISRAKLEYSWALHDSEDKYLSSAAYDFCATDAESVSFSTRDLTTEQLGSTDVFVFDNMPKYDANDEYDYDDNHRVSFETRSEQLRDVLLGLEDFGVVTGKGFGKDGLLDGRDKSGNGLGTPIIKEREGSYYAGSYNVTGYDPISGVSTGSFNGDDVDQCGQNQCNSGSFINSVAKLIRTSGLHVRHDDICESFAGIAPHLQLPGDTVTSDIHQCNLRPLTPRKTYICDTRPDGAETPGHPMFGARLLDFHEILQLCHDYESQNKGFCSSATAPNLNGFGNTQFCEVSEDQRECVVKHSYMISRGCKEIKIEGSESDAEQQLDAALMIEGSGDLINVFQRATRYARPTKADQVLVHVLTKVAPQLADADIYATSGSIDGCKSTRGIVLALYGTQLETKFRQREFDVEEKRFIDEILEVDKLVTRISEKMDYDFIRLPQIPVVSSGMKISVGLNDQPENMPEQLPFDEGYGQIYRGDEDSYFCGPGHNAFGVLEGRDKDGRTIDTVAPLRKDCVCRGHYRSQASQVPNVINYAFGYDELYLQKNNSLAGQCHTLRAYYETDQNDPDENARYQNLWSVQDYCRRFDELASVEDWERRTDRLRPRDSNIPTVSGTEGWTEEDISEIKKAIEDSLNFDFTTEKCGRIVNAVGPDMFVDGSYGIIKMSTSGANSIPFTDARQGSERGKIEIAEIIYHLEAESIGDVDRGHTLRSERIDLGANLNEAFEDDPITLSDMICAPKLTDEDTIFSFRQLRWKDSEYDDAVREDEHEPSDSFSVWKDDIGADGLYWSNNDALTGNDAAAENYCIIDWQVYLGIVSVDFDDFEDTAALPDGRSEKDVKIYMIDPIGTDARDILEIGYNVHITQKELTRTSISKTTLYKTIMDQLQDYNGAADGQSFGDHFKMIDMVGFDTYEHYAKVAAFEDDPNAFDANGNHHWNTKREFETYFGAGGHEHHYPADDTNSNNP